MADRKRELEAALQDARDQLDRGEGRTFDTKRIVAEIKHRQKKPTRRIAKPPAK